MDDPYQRRRRGDQPTHQSSQSRFSASSRQSHSPTTRSSSDGAYRPSTNPSTQMSRGVAPAGVYGSYAPEPTAQFATNTLATSVLGYGVDYGHDARTPAQPAFAAYQAPNVMYNVPTPSPQAPVYDTPQFGQRPSSGLSIMTPDMASTCFGPDAGGGSASNLPPPAPGNHGAQAAPVYQQQHQQHSSSLGYEGGVAGGANLAQQGFRVAGGTGLGHEPEYATGRLEEKWVNYQQQLASIFQNITEGSLGTASDALLSVSNWLLTQAAELGTYARWFLAGRKTGRHWRFPRAGNGSWSGKWVMTIAEPWTGAQVWHTMMRIFTPIA